MVKNRREKLREISGLNCDLYGRYKEMPADVKKRDLPEERVVEPERLTEIRPKKFFWFFLVRHHIMYVELW